VTGREQRRVLIGYTSYPESDCNAGALRLFEIARLLVEAGNRVSLLAVRDNGVEYRAALEALGIDCYADDANSLSASPAAMASFLSRGQFDIGLFSHHFVYARFARYVRALLPRCRCIVDTVDLHFLRKEREAELGLATREEAEHERRAERQAIEDADQIWVVTDKERAIIAELGWSDSARVYVVPTVHRVLPNPPGFAARRGIVFLGSYQHQPNVDAARYFVEEIVPIARKEMPDVDIFIAGSHPPDAIRRMERLDPHVKVTGYVMDHRALLADCRVAVAPLRYGAGMKGKIGEYLACGIPCVSTSIGAEGMDLREGLEVQVADDPAAFASSIVRLYGDAQLWQRQSSAGQDYIEARYTPSAIRPRVSAALNALNAIPARQGRSAASRIWGLVSSPGALTRNARMAWRSFRRGGWGEVRARYALWVNR
jgi:glycosyltransferase involved in cell wall biosynthesis